MTSSEQLALGVEAPSPPDAGARLVLGPLAELERALADEITARKAGDPLAPIAILIGGTLLRPYLQRRLADLLGGHINLHLLTAAELAVRLGEHRMIAAGRKPLPPLATRVLVGEVAREARGYFRPVAHTPGFADSLHRLFRELAQAGLSPEGFRGTADAVGGNRRKHADLAELYERYGERRASHYGPDDCLAVADSARLGADALLVYGLWDPPAALRAAIEAIVAAGTPLTAFLPATGAPADGAHEDMRRWLVGLGAAPERATPARDADESPAGTLDHLQRRLFLEAETAPATDDASLRLLSAADPAREVRAAARACLEWAAAGVPFYDMAVTYRQGEQYRPLVESTFREAGIPIYLDEGTPIAERPLGRRALTLLDLVGTNLERRAVMDFLTDADLPEDTRARYGGVPAVQWDALSRRAGVVRGREQWRDRLAALRAREEERYAGADSDGEPPPEWLPERLASIERLERFVAELARTTGAAPRRAPFADHLEYLRSLFAAYLDQADPILDALAPLAKLDALARPIDSTRFREIVASSIDRLRSEEVLDSARSGLFGRRGVNVLDVNTLRHMRFACVVVLGLNERSFPPPPRQDALLLDHEREELNARDGATRLPLRVRGADPEPLGFATAVQAATQNTFLSYARTESGEGRAQLPSSFFRAAAEALTGTRVRAEKVDRLDHPAFVRESAARIGAPSPADALTADEYDRTLLEQDPALAAAVLAGDHDFARAREAHAARHESTSLTPYDGALDGAAAEALAAHASVTGPMSPSSLETYAECPMKFFLGRVMGLGAIDEPEEIDTIDALNRGSLVHRVLERFLEEQTAAGTPPDASRRTEQLARLEEIAREECDAYETRGLTGYPLLWRYERRNIVEDLRVWYQQEVDDPDAGRFDRGAYEVRFGPSRHEPDGPDELSSDEPLRIDTAAGRELVVQGRMDRVDWSARTGDYRVIDYKTGKVRSHYRDGKLAGGRALQLPLYLMAGADRLGSAPERGEAQYLFPSRYGKFKRVRFSAEHLEERREDLERILASFAEGTRTGNFHARPEPRRCDWCDFNSLCDARRYELLDQKREDPRVREMDEIGEIE